MGPKSKTIIKISETELKILLVKPSRGEIIEVRKEKITSLEKNPEKTLGSIQETVGKKKVRIILDREHYYLVRIPYSENLTRKGVFEEVSKRIPEELDETRWDYSEHEVPIEPDSPESERKREIIAFAPTGKIYENILAPLREKGLEIEAIEPIEILAEEGQDPILALSLKKSFRGPDEEILSLDLGQEPETKEKLNRKKKGNQPSKKDGQNKKKSIALGLLAALLFAGSAFLLKRYFGNEGENRPRDSRVETDTSEKKTPKVINKEAQILILNSSGIAGAAQEVADILGKAGFGNTDTGNAEKTQPEETILLRKQEISDSLIEEIIGLLEDEYKMVESEEPLGNEQTNDVVLIIGQRINESSN